MEPVGLKLIDQDGTRRKVSSISNNRDHVSNMIAEGHLDETDRYDETVKLYEGQLTAMSRELTELRTA